MRNRDLNILILEDDNLDVELIEKELKRANFVFETKWVKNKSEFESALKLYSPDLILADYNLPSFNAIQALEIASNQAPKAPFIIVSGQIEDEVALEAIQRGTTDYVYKDNLIKLPIIIRRAIEEAHLQEEKSNVDKQLAKNHLQLENILRSANIVTWEWDLISNKVTYNDKWAGLFGYDWTRNVLDFEEIKTGIHSEDLPDMLLKMEEHIQGVTPIYIHEHRVIHKTMQWIWVLDQASVVERDKKGNAIKMSGITKNISERKEAELSLVQANKERQRSLALLDTVYKAVPVGLTIIDEHSVIISVNEALSKMTGLPIIDHVGQKLSDVLPDLAEKSVSFLQHVIKTGRPIINFEIKVRPPVDPENEAFVIASFYPVRSEDFQIIGIAINDITPIRTAENAVFESEMRFHQVQDHINAVIWIIDAETNKLQYISPSCQKFLGVNPKQMGENPFAFFEAVHPDHQAKVEEDFIQFINCENPEAFDIEFKITSEENRVRWLIHNGFAVRDRTGKIKSYGSLMQDVTNKKNAEQELLQSRNMLLETQIIAHIGSFEWIIQEQKVMWSDELYRVFGYEPGEIEVGMEIYYHHVHADDRKLIQKAVNQVVSKRQAEDTEMEHRILKSDGQVRIVSMILKVKLDEKGLPTQLLGLVQDITDKKQAEEVAQRFGRILDSSLNEIYIFKEDDLKYLQASKSALNNLDYSLDELRALTFNDINLDIKKGNFEDLVCPLKRGDMEGIEFEAIHRRKDGSKYPVEIRLQYLRSETPPVFLAEISDISERKKAQEARYVGQEMERKRIAMEIHDGIGQMLIAIKQRVSNLDFGELDHDELEERVDEIDKILAMTIEEVRRTSNNLAPIVLKKMGIEDAIEMLCLQTEKISKIKVVFDHKGPKIRAKEKILLAIYRILQEALNNMVKHSNAKQAKVQFFKDEKNISLIIADNGNGFMFSNNMKNEGNGLTNMKERASLVNGNFHIESNSKTGTYIKVDVPV